MRTLLRKELRAQLPFLLLVVFLFLLEIGEHVFGNYPDSKSLSGILNEHGEGSSGIAILYLILAMALGLALLPRERDEGTLEFLDALPCTRSRIFLAKALAGVLILGLYPLLDNTMAMFIHRLARSSLDPEWPVKLVVEMFLIELSLCVSLLGVSLALSFFRRFAFFVLGLLVATFLALNAAQVPWIHLFDFTEVVRYTFRTRQIAVAWPTLGVILGLGLTGYTAAWLVFRMQGDRTTRMFNWIERRHLRGPLTVGGTVLMIIVWIGAIIIYAASHEDEIRTARDETQVNYRSWQTSQLRAGDYVFLYPSNLRSRAAALADRSAEIHRKVREFFNAQSAGEIVADLDSHLRHLAGTADWKRVNMSIVETELLPEQIAVLGHETAHVYIDVLSDARLRKVFENARWWHEGLASYIEYRLFRPPESLARMQRVAAAAHRKKASEFELLVDDSAWRLKHDPDLAYPLGEAFLEALTAEHGEDAPASILRAIARPDAPEQLSGLDLWRDAFQACGWDLSTSVAGYYRRLQEFADSGHKEFVDSLPKLRGRVVTDRENVKISVIASGELPDDAELQCRIRRFPDDPDSQFQYLEETGANEFSIGRKWVGEGEFWYQLGIEHPDAQLVLYEDWQRARVR